MPQKSPRASARRSAGRERAGRWMIRLPASLRTGDLEAAAAAAARAEILVNGVADEGSARHRVIRAQVLSGRGAVELWAGHLDEAAHVFDSGAAAAAASGREDERASCLGHLALVEALRGRLSRAAELAVQATAATAAGEPRPGVQRPSPAALAALAWVHLEHNELRRARSRLKQVDAALAVSPDTLIGAVAFLAAARSALAEGYLEAAAQFVARARSRWPVPAWLDHELSRTSPGHAWRPVTSRQRSPQPNGPAATPRWKRRRRSRTRGWLPETPRTHGERWNPRSRPTARCPNGSACKRCWLTPGSATAPVTPCGVTGPLRLRCGSPDGSSSGCRSSWSAPGLGRRCGGTPG